MAAIDGDELDRERYEHAPCGLLSTSAGGTIERVNQTFCAWLGYPAAELVERQRIQDLLTIGCKIFHQTHWMPLLQMRGSAAEVQLDFVHRDGTVIPMIVNAVQQQAGQATRLDIAALVATDRKTYERELLAARKRAEELLESERLVQAKLERVLRDQEQQSHQRAVLAEQLIGIVSHDLRTPLNAISLGATLLDRLQLPSPGQQTVRRIASASLRANRLISDLLDLTQARLGGGLRVTRAAIDLHGMVRDCVEELRLASPGRALEHRMRGDSVVFADGDRLAQVVTNLASNALTYGLPDRPVTITSEATGAELSLTVHNEGPPVPEALIPHIFEPMRRGDQQVKLGSRSVGLGLYIVHEIARAHGGCVSVTSTAESGTSFVFRAPLAH